MEKIDRTLEGDVWIIVRETKQLQKTFDKMVGELVNYQEDKCLKVPAKMSADFIHLYL